jgi:hypothetical protein
LEEGELLAKEYNVTFFECSAKQDLNVEVVFLSLVKEIKNRIIENEASNNHTSNAKTLRAQDASAKAKKGCC